MTCVMWSAPLWTVHAKNTSLQIKQLKDTEKREKYKIYGEMINTYGYGLDEGAKVFPV